MQSKPNRRKSRAIAMELLYSNTVNVRSEEITDEFLEEFIDISETTEKLDITYIKTITKVTGEKEEFLKTVIRPFLKEWTLERVSKVNLAILKIATAEILFMDDIPERVSLNEALELSKIYSDEESTAFINGVLDKILKAKQNGTIPEELPVEVPEEPTPEEAAPAPDASAEEPDREDNNEASAPAGHEESAEVDSEEMAEVVSEEPAEEPAERVSEVGSEEPAEEAAEEPAEEAFEEISEDVSKEAPEQS